MPRAFLSLVLLACLAAACGTAPGAGAQGPTPPPEPTIRLDWLKQRPMNSPWGPGVIPATRKPRWFCLADPARPEAAFCTRTKETCEPVPNQEKCEPHARAACGPDMQACFPTIALCEANRKTAAQDRGQSRAWKDQAQASCAWQD